MITRCYFALFRGSAVQIQINGHVNDIDVPPRVACAATLIAATMPVLYFSFFFPFSFLSLSLSFHRRYSLPGSPAIHKSFNNESTSPDDVSRCLLNRSSSKLPL